jgi:hypothetical protein
MAVTKYIGRPLPIAVFSLLLACVASHNASSQVIEVPKAERPMTDQERARGNESEMAPRAFPNPHFRMKDAPMLQDMIRRHNQATKEKEAAGAHEKGEKDEKVDGPDAGGEQESTPVNIPGLGAAAIFVAMVLGLGFWAKKKYSR